MKNIIVVKWIARIIGGSAVAFFGLFAIGEGIPDLLHTDNSQLKSIMMLLLFAAFGYFFCWFKEKEGGIVLSLSGLLLGLNMFYFGGTGDTRMALVYSLPFLIPGLLFWWLGIKIKSKTEETK